jgi:hypothetical protein
VEPSKATYTKKGTRSWGSLLLYHMWLPCEAPITRRVATERSVERSGAATGGGGPQGSPDPELGGMRSLAINPASLFPSQLTSPGNLSVKCKEGRTLDVCPLLSCGRLTRPREACQTAERIASIISGLSAAPRNTAR